MKKSTLLFALPLLALACKTPSALDKKIGEMEHRAAIKNVLDTFSILADQKDVEKQLLLFTENATVESISNGQPGNVLRGRRQIGDAFSNFLGRFETVYHINGQQTVNLNDDRATAVSYCLVVLIGDENGKKIKTTLGVYYNDDFVRENGQWLIAKRQSNFAWQDKEEME